MAVKLTDLQLIYGVAGARDKFADIVGHLLEGERPGASQVRVKQGDSGIDIRVGNLSDPNGIEVYQCKFFTSVGKAQRAQIRESFKSCRDATEYKTKRWALCLPVDLSVDELQWFENWREDQDGSGILIDDAWGATKLHGLLFQEKNRGVLEAFFKQEYLTQIREMHGMMHQLLTDMARRLQEETADREQERQSSALARQAEYLDQFVQSMRAHYGSQVKRPGTMRDVQKAKQRGDHKAARAARKRPAHWEVVIRPSWIPDKPHIKNLNECWSIVQACQTPRTGWPIPGHPPERQTGNDWVGVTDKYGPNVTSWRLSQRGVFAHFFTIHDDLVARELPSSGHRWRLPAGFTPELFLDIDEAINSITHTFRFASCLAGKAFEPGDGEAHITIRLIGTRNRVLITWDNIDRLMECYQAQEPFVENTWICTREELRTNADGLAVKAAGWLFERFGWLRQTEDGLAKLQARILDKG